MSVTLPRVNEVLTPTDTTAGNLTEGTDVTIFGSETDDWDPLLDWRPDIFNTPDAVFEYTATMAGNGTRLEVDQARICVYYRADAKQMPEQLFADAAAVYGTSLADAAIGAGKHVVVGANDYLGYSTDGGTSWTQATSPVSCDYRRVLFDGNKFYAVGSQGTVVSSTDGVTWALDQAREEADDFMAIRQVRDHALAIVGGRSEVFRKKRISGTWARMPRNYSDNVLEPYDSDYVDIVSGQGASNYWRISPISNDDAGVVDRIGGNNLTSYNQTTGVSDAFRSTAQRPYVREVLSYAQAGSIDVNEDYGYGYNIDSYDMGYYTQSIAKASRALQSDLDAFSFSCIVTIDGSWLTAANQFKVDAQTTEACSPLVLFGGPVWLFLRFDDAAASAPYTTPFVLQLRESGNGFNVRMEQTNAAIATLLDGAPHHLAFTWANENQDWTDVSIYVDGVDAGMVSGDFSVQGSYTAGTTLDFSTASAVAYSFGPQGYWEVPTGSAWDTTPTSPLSISNVSLFPIKIAATDVAAQAAFWGF